MIKVGRIFSGLWPKSVTKAEKTNKLQLSTVKNNATDTFTRMCECKYSYDPSGFAVFGEFPENYVYIDKYWVKAKPAKYSYMLKKMIPERPAHWDISQRLKPCYFVDYLYSHGKGQGTRAIKDIVMKSEGLPVRTYTYIADAIAGKPRTLHDLIAVIAKTPLKFEPGTHWLYGLDLSVFRLKETQL